MAKQTINIGASPNDGTGTPLRTAFDYCNLNFTELYTATGPSGNNIVVPGSATITGDLTVDTSTLKVDSTNNRVGIRTASPAEPLTVDNSSGVTTGAIRIYAIDQSHSRLAIQNGNGQAYHLVAGNPGASNAGFALYDNTAAATRWYVDNTGVQTWQNVGGVAGTAMTLNANGLGIGVTPSAWATYKALQIGNGSIANYSPTQDFRISSNAYYASGVWKRIAAAFASQYLLDGSSGTHQWYVAGTGAADSTITTFSSAAMTLDASGNLLVGQTNAALDAQGGFWLRNAAASGGSSIIVNHRTGVISANSYAEFTYNGVGIGSITQNGTTGVLYNINSDYRLKESVAPLSGGLARVSALKPSIYKWKSDGSSGEGFLAHELAEVVPFAVTGEKDAVNEDGSIKSQGIDMSRIVPILVAAIQELATEVNALKKA